MLPEMTPLQLFGFVLHDVARLLRKTLDGYARDLKLTQAQWRTLTHLSRMQGCRQTDLAEILEVRPITLARLIDKMERSALVERRRHPTDRRAVQLHLTDDGEQVLKKLMSMAEVISEHAMSGLPEVDRKRLLASLMAMRDNLTTRRVVMPRAKKIPAIPAKSRTQR
jgi:MarR family transcriptional regulator, transcriptional regulator for hemolysin